MIQSQKIIISIFIVFIFSLNVSGQKKEYLRICSTDNDLYSALANQIEKLRGASINERGWPASCLAVLPVDSNIIINSDNRLPPGFYLNKLTEIHTSPALFVQINNENRKYLFNYDYRSFIHFITKYSNKVYNDESKECAITINLLNMWRDETFNW